MFSISSLCEDVRLHEVGIATHEITHLSITVVLDVFNEVERKLVDGDELSASLEDGVVLRRIIWLGHRLHLRAYAGHWWWYLCEVLGNDAAERVQRVVNVLAYRLLVNTHSLVYILVWQWDIRSAV